MKSGLLKDGEPCGHPGCLHHMTHPCEGCGRVGGRYAGEIREEFIDVLEHRSDGVKNVNFVAVDNVRDVL